MDELSSPPRTARRRRTSLRGGAQLSVIAIEHTIRHTALRGLGFIGMLAIALIHLLER